MAYHAHRQIREAIATALTGLTTSGSRVYPNRLYPMGSANLPGLRIYADSESVTPETIHTPILLSRELTMVVECCAQGGDTLDDTVDLMSNEVEKALSSGVTIGGIQITPLLSASSFDDLAGEYDAAVKRLEFRIPFFTLASTPDALA